MSQKTLKLSRPVNIQSDNLSNFRYLFDETSMNKYKEKLQKQEFDKLKTSTMNLDINVNHRNDGKGFFHMRTSSNINRGWTSKRYGIIYIPNFNINDL